MTCSKEIDHAECSSCRYGMGCGCKTHDRYVKSDHPFVRMFDSLISEKAEKPETV